VTARVAKAWVFTTVPFIFITGACIY
jgi:hypothetical protein